MLTLSEPQRTPYDLNFELFGFPIRIHPLFWLAALIWGFNAESDGVSMLMWVTVMLLSLLVHELGHAVMIRHYGRHARVVLYFMGGLAIEDSGSPWAVNYGRQGRTTVEQIWISAAGPLAGFLLAGITWVGIYVTGGSVNLIFSVEAMPYADPKLGGALQANSHLTMFVSNLLYINIFWGLVNLIPVIPLDGGQIAQAWLTANDSFQGTIKALWLSVFAGGAAAIIFGILMHEMFLLMLFASLAFSCYTTVQQIQGSGRGRPW